MKRAASSGLDISHPLCSPWQRRQSLSSNALARTEGGKSKRTRSPVKIGRNDICFAAKSTGSPPDKSRLIGTVIQVLPQRPAFIDEGGRAYSGIEVTIIALKGGF